MRHEKEQIICSAIWYKDLPTPPHRPVNRDRGIVFCGHRHAHCLYQMTTMTGKSQCEVGEEIQGFLTDENRFVDRKEAAKMVLSNGQVEKMQYGGGKTLYSEDLY